MSVVCKNARDRIVRYWIMLNDESERGHITDVQDRQTNIRPARMSEAFFGGRKTRDVNRQRILTSASAEGSGVKFAIGYIIGNNSAIKLVVRTDLLRVMLASLGLLTAENAAQ